MFKSILLLVLYVELFQYANAKLFSTICQNVDGEIEKEYRAIQLGLRLVEEFHWSKKVHIIVDQRMLSYNEKKSYLHECTILKRIVFYRDR